MGNLSFIRIWHDNSGIGNYASWYLGVIVIRDMQTKEIFQFVNNRWLAVEMDDGEVRSQAEKKTIVMHVIYQIDRVVPEASTMDLSLTRQMEQRKENSIRQNHLWVSVFLRPPQSRFTR